MFNLKNHAKIYIQFENLLKKGKNAFLISKFIQKRQK